MVEVFGTVAAVVGIIDVITRSLLKLDDIRKRYKDAPQTADLMHGQLVAVQAAMGQISHLMGESPQSEPHYQLVMDMEAAVKSCHRLTGILHDNISELEYDENDELTFESKVKIVLESKGVEECLQRLDRLMTALNLVINAYNARNLDQQYNLMRNPKSVEIIKQVKADSSSLYVLCDAASFVTRSTKISTASSKWSRSFIFDQELLQTRAYKNSFRSLLRMKAARRAPLLTDAYYHNVLKRRDGVFKMQIHEGKQPQIYCVWDVHARASIISKRVMEDSEIEIIPHDVEVPEIFLKRRSGPAISSLGYVRLRWSGEGKRSTRTTVFYICDHLATYDCFLGSDFARGRDPNAHRPSLIDCWTSVDLLIDLDDEAISRQLTVQPIRFPNREPFLRPTPELDVRSQVSEAGDQVLDIPLTRRRSL